MRVSDSGLAGRRHSAFFSGDADDASHLPAESHELVVLVQSRIDPVQEAFDGQHEVVGVVGLEVVDVQQRLAELIEENLALVMVDVALLGISGYLEGFGQGFLEAFVQ